MRALKDPAALYVKGAHRRIPGHETCFKPRCIMKKHLTEAYFAGGAETRRQFLDSIKSYWTPSTAAFIRWMREKLENDRNWR